MPVLRKDGPYIWTTWLSKLLVGDNSCEWASWFKTQFDGKSWTKAEQVNNLTRWQIGHTDLLNSAWPTPATRSSSRGPATEKNCRPTGSSWVTREVIDPRPKPNITQSPRSQGGSMTL